MKDFYEVSFILIRHFFEELIFTLKFNWRTGKTRHLPGRTSFDQWYPSLFLLVLVTRDPLVVFLEVNDWRHKSPVLLRQRFLCSPWKHGKKFHVSFRKNPSDHYPVTMTNSDKQILSFGLLIKVYQFPFFLWSVCVWEGRLSFVLFVRFNKVHR